MLCLVACVAEHGEGVFSTHLARLSIQSTPKPGQHKVMFCTLCEKCIDVCPGGALRWHPVTGAVDLLADRCNQCDKCVEICPTGVIVHSDIGIQLASGKTSDWYPVVCDLCGGEPECTSICPSGAIFVGERKELV
jgi:Fe-S-cluster-containing hydrogenase component 2